MTLSTRGKLLGLLAILALLGALPLILYMQSQEQETRSKAAQTTSLFFSPQTSSTNPLVVVKDQTYTFDLMMNPGANAVSTAKIDIQFDGRFVETFGANPVVINSAAFPQILEAPVITNSSIKFTVGTGTDPAKAIKTTTKVATITFNARAKNIPPATEISFGAVTLTSVAAGDQASENVYAGGQSAFVSVDDYGLIGIVFIDANGNGKYDSTTEDPVPANFGYNMTITKDGVSYPVGRNDNGTGMYGSQTDLTRGTYVVTYTNPPSGVQLFPSPPSYTVTLGENCSIQPTGGDGTCSLTDNVGGLNFALLITPTPTVTPTPTRTPTPIPPTPTATLTPTPPITRFNFTVFLHGIGHSGDSSNETAFSLSNQNPLTKTRPVNVEVYNIDPSTGQISSLATSKAGSIVYSSTSGNFSGILDMGTALQNKNYVVKVKSDKYLRRIVAIPNVIAGTTMQMPSTTLVAGDAIPDNNLDVFDYNLLYGCFSIDAPARDCTPAQKFQADLNDDGNVNQYDYNLFLRELGNRTGE